MQEEPQDSRRLFLKKGKQTGLIIVILAAVLLEGIAAFQYNYTRGMLERNLEKQVLIMLRASAMRMDGTLEATVNQSINQIWHAQQNLDNPNYVETLLRNLLKNENDRVEGATIAFCPYYFPEKGRWYEPYARGKGDSVSVEQIGSAEHDYFQQDVYKTCIQGDTMKWSSPYIDDTGAKGEVITYALPLRNADGQPVAVLAIDVTTNWISESINQIRLHPSSFSFVVSKEGNIIAAPDDSLCPHELATKIAAMIIDPTVKKELRADDRVTCFPFYDEQRDRSGHVYYARKKLDPKWTMVKVVYDDDAFGELAQMQRNIFWMTLAGLLMLAIIIQFFFKNSRKLQQSLIQQQRTDRELQIANSIQQTLLPLDEPSLQGVSEVKVNGCLIPAREVGGDLYNVFVSDGKLFFCIGDVSGKGVPAALIMAVAQTLFHNIASQESNPASIMQLMNATACRNNHSNMFITLFIGVLNLSDGQLNYCNAGHERPLLNGQLLDVNPNMPIGLFDDFTYEMQQTTIPPGSTLLLYTDGLTEARNAQKQLFGREYVVQLMSRSDIQPEDIIDNIVAEVKRYAKDTEQNDDLTLLTISYKPENKTSNKQK